MKRVEKCELKTITVKNNRAKLTCPTTEQDGSEGFEAIDTKGHWRRHDKQAINAVKQIAGQAACGGCRFAGMKRPEVNRLLGEEASAEATLILGRNELLRAEAERDALLGEIALGCGDINAPLSIEAAPENGSLQSEQPPIENL